MSLTKFNWEQSFDVGHEVLNHGHRNILNSINRIYREYEKGSGKESLLPLMKKLEIIANHHFREEEEYLRQQGDPSLIHHQNLHKEMIQQLQDYQQALATWDAEFTEYFFEFLRFWITEHIVNVCHTCRKLEQGLERVNDGGEVEIDLSAGPSTYWAAFPSSRKYSS